MQAATSLEVQLEDNSDTFFHALTDNQNLRELTQYPNYWQDDGSVVSNTPINLHHYFGLIKILRE